MKENDWIKLTWNRIIETPEDYIIIAFGSCISSCPKKGAHSMTYAGCFHQSSLFHSDGSQRLTSDVVVIGSNNKYGLLPTTTIKDGAVCRKVTSRLFNFAFSSSILIEDRCDKILH